MASDSRPTATGILWDDQTFWLTGGPDSNATELLTEDEGFVAGPDLPVEAYNHCLTKLGSDHVLMTGGVQWVLQIYEK